VESELSVFVPTVVLRRTAVRMCFSVEEAIRDGAAYCLVLSGQAYRKEIAQDLTGQNLK
jgi:hypothetical protein